MKNRKDTNYYESEFYKILLYKNVYADKFLIDIIDNTIIIERVDVQTGWGQDLNLIIFNKLNREEEIINIGSSLEYIKTFDFNYNTENYEKQHYENDLFKIFYISKSYNDTFKIDYNEISKILTVTRTDAIFGWGQKLKLKYINKKNKDGKIINIGSSLNNFINIILDDSPNNYYESSNFIITLFENKYNDKFKLFFYEDNNTIYLKRLDAKKGWGQILMLNIFDIKKSHNFIIYIGSSINNEIYKKIDLTIHKCYIALTTIPSRIKLPIFIENIKDILNKQKDNIENIFITIPLKYKRFNEIVDDKIIHSLNEIPKVIIIRPEDDYGPASKYLGPLIHNYKDVKNNILIIIDDDRKYNKNLVRNFKIAYNSFPNITFSSGLWSEYFNKSYKKMNEDYLELQLYKEKNDNTFYYGQGLGGFFGFAIHVKNIEKFINYNILILNKLPKSFYHDEGIILGYLKSKEEKILYLKHYGCNYIVDEMVDALCKSNIINRGVIEKEILQITNLENIE
jgi:hypothetical protein